MRIFVTLLFILSCANSFAQNDLMDLPRYKGIFLGLGPRFINTDPGAITTSFRDDSPSMDQFFAVTDIKDLYVRTGLQIGWKWGNYNGLSHDILVDIAMSKSYHAAFGYSIGWNFEKRLAGKRLLIRPAAQALIGNGVFYLGEIQNNAAYIQIGESQYYDRELEVTLRAQSFNMAARLDLTYKILPKIDLFAKFAYDFEAGNSNPKLEFSVPDTPNAQNTGGSSSELPIDGTNPLVTYNGDKLEELPYTVGGLRFTVGASYVWERRKKK